MIIEKKDHRSGRCLRNEPEGLDVLLNKSEVERDFKQVGYWRFCEKLQGGHMQVTKEFAFNFKGLNSKVGVLELPISLEVISAVTEIPRGQDRWFKNFKFDMTPCKEFLKPEFVDSNLNKLMSRSFVKDSYANLLTCIQRYFTCEGRYHKVYSYHKLLLHFTGKISLDFPFYLFRSLVTMCDKVQLKKEACETSLFHHGLVKLIVLHELQKIDREWSIFLFMSGFRNETGLGPQATRISSPAVSLWEETRSRRFIKLKARKQVKEPMRPLVIQDTPQKSQKKKVHIKEGVQEQSTGEMVQRRVTKSQLAREKGKTIIVDGSPASKGSLNDLLQAIDIKESPLVRSDLMEASKGKTKKAKTSKKLKFDDQASEFAFKPRRPVTRRSKEIQEAQPEASEIGEVAKLHEGLVVSSETSSKLHKNDRGKAVVSQQEECSFEELKKKLKLANLEISKLRKTSRKHAIKEAYFNKMEALWEDKTISVPKVDSCHAQYFTWMIPTIKEARYIRKVNAKLRTGI